jgi:site-specific recombinase XerD
MRSEMITKHDPMNQALFPAIRSPKGDGRIGEKGLNKMKHKVELQTSTTFQLRACRRTFGQNLIDQGASIESVSVLLGHNTTKTTETYYARKRQDAAIREVKGIWSQPNYAVNKLIET